jgi:hypothetical protein
MEGEIMATLDKTSKYYDISSGTKKYIKFLCKRKARRNRKKGLNEINPKKLVGCQMYYFDRYW